MDSTSFIALEQQAIKNNLPNDLHYLAEDCLEVYASIGSTSEHLRKKVNNKAAINICLAETQTKGKGRLNHVWHSPYGKNIYFSMAYPFRKKIAELSGLSLVVGMAAAKAIEASYDLSENILLKWPNDLKINHQKIAGNLVEIKTHAIDHCHVIVGIGINVNMDMASDAQINQAWTSIKKIQNPEKTPEEKIELDRNILVAKLIEYIILYFQRFEKFGFSDFVSEWQLKDVLLGQKISISENDQVYHGVGAGVNSDGHLLVMLENGTQRAFVSGEAFLLK